MPKKKPTIGQMLVNSLTLEQVASLLTVISASTDLNVYIGELKKIDLDMAATVNRIISPKTGPESGDKTKRLASMKRTLDYWHSLWRNWDEIIGEVGDEEGKYAFQEHHWEPPFFDGSSLASDLEPIGEDMLSLIDDVYDEVDDPALFSKALDDIEYRIGGYPEYMGAEHGEPCILEKRTTECVLKWLWLSSQRERNPGRRLLEEVLDLENSLELVVLHQQTLIHFFVGLPDDICQETYEFFKTGELNVDLNNIYSVWHHINHEYEGRFDAGTYLETCRKNLAENWHYGRPLVDNALQQNDLHDAESYLVKTFQSYLRSSGKKEWYPETSLLLTEIRSFHNEREEEIASLLTTWADVAKRLKRPDRSGAAELQAMVFRMPYNWDSVLKVYNRLSGPDSQEALKSLFTQWKNEMAARSYPYFMEPHKASDTWIQWLIEAKLDVTQGKEWFSGKLVGWLSELKDNAGVFKKQWRWLALLTEDLVEGKKIRKKYPSFFETVLHDEDSWGDLTTSRRKGLREMKAGSCFNSALEVWQKHLRRIVPDPAAAYQSNYEEHARWAQALLELDRDEYKVLVAQWRKKHNRRRNLWHEMNARGLPVE